MSLLLAEEEDMRARALIRCQACVVLQGREESSIYILRISDADWEIISCTASMAESVRVNDEGKQ